MTYDNFQKGGQEMSSVEGMQIFYSSNLLVTAAAKERSRNKMLSNGKE